MPCPTISFTTGSPANPAPRGGLAVAVTDPATGNFGLLGSVELRCGGAVYPVTNVTWAALSVSFLVPAGLPQSRPGMRRYSGSAPTRVRFPNT
jgi:hypothetical protein